MYMVFDRSICFLPEDTVLEEKVLRCKNDIIISDRAQFHRGIITEGRLFLGEFVEIRGDLVALGDIRVDKGCRIAGDITGDSDIFLGERSMIKGEVVVGKNLDIGEGVDIDPDTIESRGFINIRNPISVIVYILIYLLELIKRSDSTEVDDFFKELEAGEEDNFLISKNFTYLPKGSKLEEDRLFVAGDIKIGPRSQIVSTIEAEGDIEIGNEAQIFGDILAGKRIYIGENVVINGKISSGSEVVIHHAARIGGDIRSKNIVITPDTIVEGTLRGDEGIKIMPNGDSAIEERILRFEGGMDSMEGFVSED